VSVLELAAIIGRLGLLRVDGLGVAVEIVNVRQAYGQVRYDVKPVAGTGTVTVAADRVTLED